jgi:hypothetical protein
MHMEFRRYSLLPWGHLVAAFLCAHQSRNAAWCLLAGFVWECFRTKRITVNQTEHVLEVHAAPLIGKHRSYAIQSPIETRHFTDRGVNIVQFIGGNGTISIVLKRRTSVEVKEGRVFSDRAGIHPTREGLIEGGLSMALLIAAITIAFTRSLVWGGVFVLCGVSQTLLLGARIIRGWPMLVNLRPGAVNSVPAASTPSD